MNAALIKNIVMLFSFFLWTVVGTAQNYVPIKDPKTFQQKKEIMDSLIVLEAGQKQDTNAIKYFISLSDNYCYFSFDSALVNAEKAFRLAENCHNPQLIAECCSLLASIYHHTKDLLKEEYYLDKGLQFAMKNKIYEYELYHFRRGLNNLYFYKGDYYKAARNSSDGLAKAELVNDKKSMLHFNSVLGYVYMKQGNYKLSEDFYQAELNISKAINDSFLIGHSLLGIAELSYTQGKFEKFQKNFEKSRQEFEQSYKTLDEALFIFNKMDTKKTGMLFAPRERQAYILNKQALILQATGKLQAAIDYSNKTIALADSASCNPYDIAEFYITAGSILNDLNRPGEALKKLNKGLSIAIDISHRENKQNAYEYLARSYKLLNIYDSAFMYQQLFYSLRDSIFNGEVQMKINDISRNKEILLLNQDKKIKEDALVRQQLIRNVIIGIALLVIIILALLYNSYRIKQKIAFQKELNRQQNESFNAIVALQDKERKRIAQDLHDGLGPVLSAAKLKLSEADASALTEKEHAIYAAAAKLLDEASTELRNISHNIMPATLSKLGLVIALKNLFDSISYAGLSIHFNAHGFEERLTEETEISLYRIILELVNNVVKHARAKNLSVQLIKYPQYINLTVEDDGVGFDDIKMQSSGKGIGMSSLRSRVELLKGNLEIDSSPGGAGTTIIADIPYEG